MRTTVMHGAGDVHVETVPNVPTIESTDAIVRVRRAAICHSDLWPYKQMGPSETDHWPPALSTLRHPQQEEIRQ
jgi:threonine dehydrogenase-like Zn-dependent dehydrogenase